jgi:hypothetical protein
MQTDPERVDLVALGAFRPLLELVRDALERADDRVAHAAALVAVDNVLDRGWTPAFAADWMRGFLARSATPPPTYTPPARPFTATAPRRHHHDHRS